MENKGQITVFLSLILISLLGLFWATSDIVGIYMNKARVAEAARGASLHIEADYQREVFDRYHLLLLDKNYMGSGEGKVEEKIWDYLDYTLSEYGFSINDICLANTRSVLADNCYDLKKQIDEYMTLYFEKQTLEKVKKELQAGDMAADSIGEEIHKGKTEEAEQEGTWQGEDPRKLLNKEMKKGLLNIVLPEGKGVSRTDVSLQNIPSVQLKEPDASEDIDISFSNIDRLEADLGKVSMTDHSAVEENINSILYAMECFGNYMEDKKDDCIFQCEVEYLIGGKNNDYDNLACVINKIILHRLPMNMAVLLTDAEKMAEISSMAATLALIPGVTYGAAKYLLAACISYGETILEIRTLLAGKKIPLVKKSTDWKLDLANIGKLSDMDTESYEGIDGIDYESFLMLLLAEHTDQLYYRMCDLIQLNIGLKQEDFRIADCIDAFTVDLDIAKGRRKYDMSVSAVY